MPETITREDIDNLADIIWWIKGYRAGADADGNRCPFGSDHVESLRKVRINWKEEHPDQFNECQENSQDL